MKRHSILISVLVLLFIGFPGFLSFGEPQGEGLPKGFVYVDRAIPDIIIDLRYYTAHNFVGERIDGYLKPRCILTKETTEALLQVQKELQAFGLGLKIFDAYRPQQAVDHFVRWANNLEDTRTKAEFYPDINKNALIRDGYIAARSSHSRGSTVDLTIVSLQAGTAGQELDMATDFDFFGPASSPFFPGLSPAQRAHRMLLHTLMKRHGFEPYPEEWWHFTLKSEPFSESYFNFPVQ
jgi:D-alanyl-D-alanine dipeptidase